MIVEFIIVTFCLGMVKGLLDLSTVKYESKEQSKARKKESDYYVMFIED